MPSVPIARVAWEKLRLDELVVDSPAGAVLGVRFVRLSDRYQHVVFVRSTGEEAGETSVDLLRSVEGTPAEAWPVSPPLQSLSIETLAEGRRAALLVGMAGRGHWSASIEADAPSGALVFDIACRSSAKPERLQSQYERPASDLGVRRLPLGVAQNQCEIRIGDHRLSIRDDGGPAANATLNAGEGPLTIDCAALSTSAGPTWRWRYRVELLPALGQG